MKKIMKSWKAKSLSILVGNNSKPKAETQNASLEKPKTARGSFIFKVKIPKSTAEAIF